MRFKHGMSYTPTFRSWWEMRRRCLSTSRRYYYLYGGRGITFCKRWDEFENFLADMGERPDGKTLDRIDGNGNYEPSNCRWATPKEQSRNSRHVVWLTFNGRTMCIRDWAKEIEIKEATLAQRILAGWTTQRALTEPIRKPKAKI